MGEAGTHLIIDGFVEDASSFEVDRLRSLFFGLVDVLKMAMLREPEFIEVPLDEAKLRQVQDSGEFQDEGGVTGFCVISTSHMSIHCWPLRKFFSLDVFSCKDFNVDQATNHIERGLGTSRICQTVVRRKTP